MLIYLVEAAAPLCLDIAQRLSAPGLTACTSGIVRMECLVGPLKRQDQGLVAVYRDIFDILEALPISDAAWELAAELRATHGLIAPDALHLAVAELNGCDEFWTADTHFERMAGKVQTRVCLLQ